MVCQLGQILPQQPAAALRQSGHRRTDANGLLKGVAVFVNGFDRDPLSRFGVIGSGGGGARSSALWRVAVHQILPYIPQILRPGHTEKHQQESQDELRLKPYPSRPTGQKSVGPLFVLPQKDIHQEQRPSHTHAGGVGEDRFSIDL